MHLTQLLSLQLSPITIPPSMETLLTLLQTVLLLLDLAFIINITSWSP
jgi:hypothetical protein